MAPVIKGNQLTSLLELCEGHRFTRDQNGNDELTIRFACAWASRFSLLPAIGSAATAAGYENLFLAQVNTDRDEAGQAQIDLIYKGSLVTFDGLPLTSYSLRGAGQEVPIQQHPQFNTFPGWNPSTEIFDSGVLIGRTSYTEQSATFTETSYSRSSPSQTDLRDIGKVSNPPFLRDVTPKYWMLIGVEATNQGSFWQYQKTWQYYPALVIVDINGLVP